MMAVMKWSFVAAVLTLPLYLVMGAVATAFPMASAVIWIVGWAGLAIFSDEMLLRERRREDAEARTTGSFIYRFDAQQERREGLILTMFWPLLPHWMVTGWFINRAESREEDR